VGNHLVQRPVPVVACMQVFGKDLIDGGFCVVALHNALCVD
jgi:hypothetical protein